MTSFILITILIIILFLVYFRQERRIPKPLLIIIYLLIGIDLVLVVLMSWKPDTRAMQTHNNQLTAIIQEMEQ